MELKRLKIDIVRPSINHSFADFKTEKNKIYYGLGAIKNVGFEAISNIIKESLKIDNLHDKITENSLSVPLKEAREKFEKEYLTVQLKEGPARLLLLCTTHQYLPPHINRS